MPAVQIKVDFKVSEIKSEVNLQDLLDKNEFESKEEIKGLDFPLEERKTEEDFMLYKLYSSKKEKDYFIYSISTGLVHKLILGLKEKGIEFTVDNLGIFKLDIQEPVSNTLRDYQKEAVNTAIKKKRLIVKNPTGSGKTFILSELCRLLDKETILLVVPYIDLSSQIKQNLEEYLKEEVGYIGNSINKVSRVTVGIPNSVQKLSDEVLSQFSVFIYDEIHLLANKTGLIIASKCNKAKMVVGLSATPNIRQLSIIEAIAGPILVDIDEKEMIDKKIILNPDIKFIKVPKVKLPSSLENYQFSINSWSLKDTLQLNQLVREAIVEYTHRNRLAVDIVKDFLINNKNGVIIVLVSRVGVKEGTVSHAVILQEMIEKKMLENSLDIRVPIVKGQDSKKKRDKVLKELRNEESRVAIFSEKLITVGIDIPNISSIVLCAGGAGKHNFIQKVGRALRTDNLNRNPEVWDFYDSTSVLKRMAEKRIRYAKEVYNNVEIIGD